MSGMAGCEGNGNLGEASGPAAEAIKLGDIPFWVLMLMGHCALL